jgi:mycothiol system anti-sigma-R factor
MAQLWEYLDQELTPETMVAVRSHLNECSACHPHAEFAERFLEALGRCRCKDPMPEPLRDRVLESLRKSGFLS